MKKDKNLEDFSFEEERDCSCKKNHNCGCAEAKECTCGDDCHCGENCTCHESDSCQGHTHEHKCKCHEEGHKCHCHEQDCECDDECDVNCDCDCHDHERVDMYLAMAQRLQADFDNYRKHVAEQLDYARDDGKKSVISVFLPCLDTFKEAKKSIADEKVLAGVNMIEDKILNSLKSLKVEKIESIGQKYNHNYHEVIAVMRDESKEDDIVLDEFQAGYTFNGKVIRYSKVIVNKLD